MNLAQKIQSVFQGFDGVFELKLLYEIFSDEKKTTLRGRVYRELIGQGVVERVGRGLYKFTSGGNNGVILNRDARDLSVIKDSEVELVVADHPYEIIQGTNRSINSTYKESTFVYTLEDFKEKARVLKDGCFLIEFLPETKETNWEYIQNILLMAKKAGFNLYCKTTWYKAELRDGKLIDHSAFIGRKAVCEDVYVFSKGKPRRLRERKQGSRIRLERGASCMFPAIMMYPVKSPSKRVHKAEKPKELLGFLVEALTQKCEIVLDQFSGSLNLFFEAVKRGRKAIALEKDEKILLRSLVSHLEN